MKPATLLVLGLLALAGLAGCSEKAAPQAQATGTAPAATTGTVRGVVVDAAIRPLASALVTLRVGDAARTANTTGSGLFRFDGVPAGSHVLRAHRTGYLDVQLQVQVEAGVAEPGEVKVTLEGDPAYRKPFIQPFKFTGIMECSAVVNAPQPAGRAAVAVCALPGQTVGVSPTQDSFIALHTLDAGQPQFVQSELVWTPGSQFANTLLLYLDQRNHTAAPSVNGQGASTGYNELANVAGPSPLVVHVEGPGVNRLGRGYDLQLRVFAWFEDPMPVGAVVEQDFTLYSHVFYGFSPPAGWTFGKDGLPPIPDA
jgi:hypothetical protein